MSVDRSAVHAAVSALMDAIDAYRAPPADELIKVRDLPYERRAVAEWVRTGALRTVTIGRERWTRQTWVLAAVEGLPTPAATEPTDELARAASKRARRAAT